ERYWIQSGKVEEYSISPVYSSSVSRTSAMSSQPVVLASWNSSLAPLQAFHWEMKSLIVMGEPSSHTPSGLYFTVTICGSSLVTSAESTVSGLSSTEPSSAAV